MNRFILIGLAPLAAASNALAQPPDPHAGHPMPEAPATAPIQPPARREMTPEAATQERSADQARPEMLTGAQLPVGDDLPPPPPGESAADRVFGAATMQRARDMLRDEHGGERTSKVMANLLEYRFGTGVGAYHWDGEAWFGGDINRLVLKSEGGGDDDRGLEAAEVQALYSRAVRPFTDIQIGLRHDFEPGPSRTYLAVGVETLMPYWFETDATLFLSEEGDVLARIEGSYDLRLTQRLILQPRVELEFAGQNTASNGTGSGLSKAEFGLRLRYDIRREFAPYIGVVQERRFGRTADFARTAGEDVETTSFAAGVRVWF